MHHEKTPLHLETFCLNFLSSFKNVSHEKLVIINLEFEDKATKNLSQIAKKQLPFVVAKSLTHTAQEAQKAVRKHIRADFYIRKKSGGFESSIRIKPATKKNLTSEVYTMASFAALQQTGGTKKARDGRLAIPIYDNIKQVKRKTQKNGPSAYLAGDAFKIRTSSGNEVIAKRQQGGLKILYFLRKEAEVEKRFDMVEIVTDIAKNNFSGMFNRNLAKILRYI